MGGLSLVVTAYNAEKFIPRFSTWLLIASKYLDQVIIVDDCSTDKTVKELHKLLYGKLNYELYQLEENSGRPSIPRNIGIEKAKHERIVFLDIDDCLPYQYLNFLSKCTDDCIYSGVKLPIPFNAYNPNYTIKFDNCKYLKKKDLDSKNMVVFSGSSILTSLATKHSFKNIPLEDWLYWQEIMNNHPDVSIVRLLDVPIFYDSSQSLSPKKFTQISRVVNVIGSYKFLSYVFRFIQLKISEIKLRKRYFLWHKSH